MYPLDATPRRVTAAHNSDGTPIYGAQMAYPKLRTPEWREAIAAAARIARPR